MIYISTENVTNKVGCENLLKRSAQFGDIGGIFNLAVILKDASLEHQTVQNFDDCFAPKVYITKHLSDLSERMCRQLKYFVTFSSVACGRGNANQTNYAMANSEMERIMEQRVSKGLPGKAIQWGPIGEVGIVADLCKDLLDVELYGLLQQRLASCLSALDQLIMCDDPIVASMVIPLKSNQANAKENFLQTILNILGIRNIKSVPITSTLSDFGVDSLMIVEIKQTLEREFDIFLTNEQVRALTLNDIKNVTENTGNIKNVDKLEKNIPYINSLNDLLTSFDEKISLSIENEKTIIQLNSVSRNNATECILIIPGVEGCYQPAWDSLTNSLNIPTFFLQLTNSAECKTIADICQTFKEVSSSFTSIFIGCSLIVYILFLL